MAKNIILVNTKADILKYDNRKAIELAQTLGRPLTYSEYESLKIKKHVSGYMVAGDAGVTGTLPK
jgi:hypothetical protein